MSIYSGPAEWWTSDTTDGKNHIASKGIIQSNLLLNLDAGATTSYSGSGPIWTDLSTNGNNGSISGAVFSNLNGGVLVFDGVDDSVACGTFSSQYLTISAWVYKTSSATNQGICRKNNGWAISQVSGTLQVAPGTNWAFVNTGYVIPLNTWVNIVYTYDGARQIVYINGDAIFNNTSASGPIVANTNPVRIGFDDSGWFWGGRIAQCSIYNRALTAQEVQKNFRTVNNRFDSTSLPAPVNTAIPVVSGTTIVGNTLTSTTGTWVSSAPITYSYLWQRGTTNIAGASNSTYLLQASDVGFNISCIVSATSAGSVSSAVSGGTATITAPVPPANTAVPTISGTVAIGNTLTSTTGTWTGTPTYTYQWQRGTTNIVSATSSTYVVQAADYANTLRCVVTATNAAGSAAANTANTVAVPAQAPVNTAVPAIGGVVAIGNTLTSTTGTWTGTPTPTFSPQWQRGTTNIAGATSGSYVVQAADYANTLRCVVTATNAGGSAAANSANTVSVPAQAPVNTAVPTISGTVAVGSTLSSTTGTWTGTPTPTYAYQWQRGTTNISGATASTYVAQAADVGSTLRCVVTATNAGGSAAANSANTVAVPPAPTPVGQQQYVTAGTFTWVAPAGVTSVCVVCVGAGGGPAANASGAGGAGGGGLGWKNNIAVVPGNSYTVQVGAGGTRVTTTSGTAPAGGNSFFINASTVAGLGGGGGRAGVANAFGAGGGRVGDGGGNGGSGGARGGSGGCGGGGGAGGYSGVGGNGATGQQSSLNGIAGAGGGGGGGGGGGSADTAGSGGGVGILGQGANGAGGRSSSNDGAGGFGGSGGGNASQANSTVSPVNVYGTGTPSTPGLYGGGGSGSDNPTVAEQSNGGGGAVRIIWGAGRAFPSTNTGNL